MFPVGVSSCVMAISQIWSFWMLNLMLGLVWVVSMSSTRIFIGDVVGGGLVNFLFFL